MDISPTRPRDHAAEAVRALIAREGLQPGDRLPGERVLCSRFGFNRTTLRSAVARLEQLGILVRAQGSGTFVRPRKVLLELKATHGFTDSVREAGFEASSRVEICRLTDAPCDIAERLDIPAGQQVLRLGRVRLVDGRPALFEVTNVRIPKGFDMGAHDFSRESLYEVLEEECGIRVTHEEARLSVTALDSSQAAVLGRSSGDVSFKRSGVAFDETMKPVECYSTVALPEIVRYGSELVRSSSIDGGAVAVKETNTRRDASLAPKYVQLREAVRNRIINGEYAAGQAISTEQELAHEFGVSRLTVRAGLDGLVEEGLLARMQGRGMFVRRSAPAANLNEIGGFRPVIEDDGGRRPVSRRLLTQTLRAAGPWYASVFSIAEEDVLLRVRILTSLKGRPVSIEESLVPLAMLEDSDPIDFTVFTVDDALGLAGHEVVHAEEYLDIISLEQNDARLLGQKAGRPALYLEVNDFDCEGKPVGIIHMTAIGDGSSFATSY